MNRRDFTRRAMFGLFGGAAAVTAEAAPQKKGHATSNAQVLNRFRHKTGLGFYDFAWSGWHQIYNQPVCCAQWYAMPVVDPRGAPWSRRPGIPLWQPYGFYSSTTGTAGPMQGVSWVVDTTLMEGHPIITPFSTHKQKADSRLDAYDRLMKMIEEFDKSPAEPPMVRPIEPPKQMPIEEMIAKFK